MRNQQAAGFTLLELLIALTLLSFILALLFGGLRLAARSWDAGELHSANSTHLALVQGFLRREMSQIYPFRWKKKADAELAFVGEPSRMQFVAPIAMRQGFGGLYLVSLELVRDGDKSQFLMKRAMLAPDSGDFSALDDGEKVVLAEKLEKLAFAYYGATTKDAGPLWSDHWINPKSMPDLIRIRIKFGNGRDWPDLVVAPQINAAAGAADPSCMWVAGCVNGRRP